MKLEKRIKRIVSLTVEDYLSHGYIIKESPKSLISSLSDALMQDESIEDAHTYEISIKVLEMLKSLDIVDLEYIHATLFKNDDAVNITLSFIVDDEVQNG